MWWLRIKEAGSWRKGFGCPDVERVGDIVRDTVGGGVAGEEVDGGLDRGKKTRRKTRRKGK